ncbi:MAG: glycerate kinase [Clostridia bacterium]|nr:glycerate kinase [Clostridia bacterium]
MKIVIAPDSFKGSLSAQHAAESIKKGVKSALDCETVLLPMADGGEGTAEVVAGVLAGSEVNLIVKGPLGEPTSATYYIAGDLAVMEMAVASGITLVPREKLNPLKASTYGTGQMIADALSKGVRKIIIGIGGSATNDGGMGMAAALGVKFIDKDGKELIPCGENLEKIAEIDLSGINQKVKNVEIKVACDVTNPLCGENGASAVFGPQKGATPEMVKQLDAGLLNMAKKAKKVCGTDLTSIPGGGAAGGLGAGLVAFCGGVLEKGFDIISEAVKLEEKIKGADLVITGEGATDRQTAFGKLPAGVGGIAKKCGVPCVLISGALVGDVHELYDCGITAAFAAVTKVTDLDDVMKNAAENLERAAENVARLFGGR